MPTWIIPALKAVLPHVGTIVSAAQPIFSKPRADTGADSVLQQQIAELQAAAAQNDAHIRELAEQLQSTVTALEQAAVQAETQAHRMERLARMAVALSCAALALAAAAFLAQ